MVTAIIDQADDLEAFGCEAGTTSAGPSGTAPPAPSVVWQDLKEYLSRERKQGQLTSHGVDVFRVGCSDRAAFLRSLCEKSDMLGLSEDRGIPTGVPDVMYDARENRINHRLHGNVLRDYPSESFMTQARHRNTRFIVVQGTMELTKRAFVDAH
jgi:hypothetical protein